MNTLSDQLRRCGFVHLPGFFSATWATQLRNLLRSISSTSDRLDSGVSFKWGFPGAVSAVPVLWPLLFERSALDVVRDALQSAKIAHAENSDAKVWQCQKSTGWHRDGIEQKFGQGDEWSESTDRYGIVRVAMYVHADSDEVDWGCIPGSHMSEYSLDETSLDQLNQLEPRPSAIPSRLGYLKTENGRLPIQVSQDRDASLVAPEFWAKPRAGDLLMFDPRLIHAAGDVPGQKLAVFHSFGLRNVRTQQYANFHLDIPEATSRARQQFHSHLRKFDLLLSSLN